MALYHFTARMVKRSIGKSAVGTAAYNAGVKIKSQHDGTTYNYTKKQADYSEIILPYNAPPEYKDRSVLWNAVEKSERRHDSQTARIIELALLNEIRQEENIKIVRRYIIENFISRGMCADFSVYAGRSKDGKKPDNPHTLIMLTTRTVTPKGFLEKDRTWNDRKLVQNWRKAWADIINGALEAKGLDIRVDHRSLAEQGIEKKAEIHLGKAAHEMERRGVQTDRGNINREIQKDNAEYEQVEKELDRLMADRRQILSNSN